MSVSHLSKHVGASWAGNPCSRFLWLRWRNAYDIPEPIPKEVNGVSILEIGKKSESSSVASLRESGFKIVTTPAEAAEMGVGLGGVAYDKSGDTKKQFRLRSPDYPYVIGYLDGIIVDDAGKLSVLEIKTMAVDKFYLCRELGIREVYPMYWVQIQIYMHLSGIRQGIFVYSARGDDGTVDPSNPMFRHIERVPYVAVEAEKHLHRIRFALDSPVLPSQPTVPNPCQYWCKYAEYCANRSIAADTDWPVPTCRTCVAWLGCYQSCTHTPSEEDFAVVCDEYSPMPELIPANARKRNLTVFGIERYVSVSGQSVPLEVRRIKRREPSVSKEPVEREETEEGIRP